MKLYKKFTLIILLFLLIPLTTNAQERARIGIILLSRSSDIESAIRGFKDAIAERGTAVEYKEQDAKGGMATLISTLERFISSKIDIILALDTFSAQASLEATSNIPIIVCGIPDPIEAGLAISMFSSGNNLTGVVRQVSTLNILQTLKDILPSAKNLGFIYDHRDPSAELKLNIARGVCRELNLDLVEIGLEEEGDAFREIYSQSDKVEAFFVTTPLAFPSIEVISQQEKIPIFADDFSLIEKGAIAGLKANYYELGRQAGGIALRIIKGASPENIPLEYPNENDLVINLEIAKQIEVDVPLKVISQAKKLILPEE